MSTTLRDLFDMLDSDLLDGSMTEDEIRSELAADGIDLDAARERLTQAWQDAKQKHAKSRQRNFVKIT